MDQEIQDYKIYPMYEVLYIECIKTASLNAIESWEKLNQIVLDNKLFESDAICAVDLSENIVNQAGIISKFFFPSRFKSVESCIHRLRGEKLRESYKISDDNILRDRDFRNYIEHFDEKLDLFLKDNFLGSIAPSKMIFLHANEINNFTSVFRAFVSNEFIFVSLNKKIHIIPLIEEIYRIHSLCIDFIENGGRL